MNAYPTVKEQWDALTLIAMLKSAHARVHMHQSFLDMQCPKGGNIREFLTSLKKQRHELKAAGVTVTGQEYKRTVLNSILEPLSSYASLTMSSLCLTCKLTYEPFNMTDVINTLCVSWAKPTPSHTPANTCTSPVVPTLKPSYSQVTRLGTRACDPGKQHVIGAHD